MRLPHPNRRLLMRGFAWLLLTGSQVAHSARLLAVRLWPAREYSRVALESDEPLRARHALSPDPPRLTVDIDGLEPQPVLRDAVAKVGRDDPYIRDIRLGPAEPGRVQLVIDLRQAASVQFFSLKPVANYQHRLVLDLYPLQPIDPLDTLIAELQRRDAYPASPTAATPAPGPTDDPLGRFMAERLQTSPTPASQGRTTSPEPPSLGAGSNAAASQRMIIVALDPGHGGEDPGAIGPGGTREKDVVLQVALLLRERINARPQMRAFLTRDADFFVPLHVRVQKARRVQADLFISIHADAFFTPRPQGASVFALSERGASSSAARWLADKENAADGVGGMSMNVRDPSLRQTLFDMSTTAQINDSLQVGRAMLGELGRVGKLHKPRVEQAGFAVLRAPDIPSVLVETAFISNPDEEIKLRDEDYQRQLADALMRGIERYFANNPPLARNRPL